MFYNFAHCLSFFVDKVSGDLDVAKDAVVQVLTRLRANIFDREGAVSAFLPVLPYLPVSAEGSDGSNYDNRDVKRHGRGHNSYSSGYGGSSDLAAGDGFGSYGSPQVLPYRYEFLRILHVDESEFLHVQCNYYFLSIVCNTVSNIYSLVAAVVMELMEVILWDGLVLLGN